MKIQFGFWVQFVNLLLSGHELINTIFLDLLTYKKSLYYGKISCKFQNLYTFFTLLKKMIAYKNDTDTEQSYPLNYNCGNSALMLYKSWLWQIKFM